MNKLLTKKVKEAVLHVLLFLLIKPYYEGAKSKFIFEWTNRCEFTANNPLLHKVT